MERSSYYAWKNRQGKSNSYVLRRKSLAGVVCEIFAEQKRRAGARGITAELAKRGYVASVRLVGRIMRENGLVAIQSAAYKKPQHREPVSEVMVVDHVEQDFTPCHYEPGQVLVGDITYLKTRIGWLYLAVVIDLATRKVLGWHVADNMRTPLVITALEAALGNGAARGCVFHSDRGSQYTSVAFERYCTTRGVTQSKGRVATCYDNAVAESFFSTFKVEFYYQHTHPGGLVTKAEIAQWITFYNTTRFHSALAYNSPQDEWDRRSQHPQAQAA